MARGQPPPPPILFPCGLGARWHQRACVGEEGGWMQSLTSWFLADSLQILANWLCMDNDGQVLQSSIERSVLKTWQNLEMIPKVNCAWYCLLPSWCSSLPCCVFSQPWIMYFTTLVWCILILSIFVSITLEWCISLPVMVCFSTLEWCILLPCFIEQL